METWKEIYAEMHEKAYKISMVKPRPSKWIEDNIILPDGVSRIKGPFKYRNSPYTREVVDNLASDNPSKYVAIMKSAQIGFTQGVLIPGMAYIISEDAAPILFMAGNKDLAKTSIEERLDPILNSSGLMDLIRPSVIRGKNQRTGNTSLSKEYAGGRLTVEGVDNVHKFRQISVRNIFADDFDAAPRSDKKEGSIRKTFEARTTSYGNMAKLFFISTPTVKGVSNIEEAYLLGDQREWSWCCPHCNDYFPVKWRTELENGEWGGVYYELDDKFRLINSSVKYKCPNCLELIPEGKKFDMNLAGKWIPTAEPQIENFISYSINNLACPPGFITWVDLVKAWLEACPPNQPVRRDLLKAFYMTQLGLPWEERGEKLKVNQLMKNTREYSVGVVPDLTSENDGNGRIVLLTIACDLNGIMNNQIKDVRLDWELKAHSANGQSYSVEHGSIGTFKRARTMTKKEYERDLDRERYTYDLSQENSVWNRFEEIIKNTYICESGVRMKVGLVVVDTGYFTNYAKKFISSVKNSVNIVGIKGRVESDFRKLTKDTPLISKSREQNDLYILESNLLKDIVADNMRLLENHDGTQPEGFMNFPMPSDGLYTMKSYFSHFESERKVEETVDGEVVGYKWEKVHSSSQNHFWDVHIYNFVAREIYLDLLKRADPKNFKDVTWASFVNKLGL